ncbi:hypothetical protein COOONC_24661 [Cooperia oncophora]
MATCEIEKNMITIRRAIFCYLTNTTDFIAQNRSISTEFWDNRLCDDSLIYDSISSVERAFGTNLTLFTVIRHPIDRFLSGYVDKCMNDLTYYTAEERCFGCRDDMKCFVDRLHALFIQYYDGVKSADYEKARFNDYYVRHFAPQTWPLRTQHCPNTVLYIIVDYGSGPDRTQKVANDFQKVFRRAQVPDHHLQIIYTEMMSKCSLNLDSVILGSYSTVHANCVGGHC